MSGERISTYECRFTHPRSSTINPLDSVDLYHNNTIEMVLLDLGAIWTGYKATKAVDRLRIDLKPLIEPGASALKSFAFITVSTAFAQTVAGVCAAINTYSGVQAQKKLISICEEIGGDIKTIATSLKSIDDGVGELVSHKAQHEFPAHVYDFVHMRSEQEATSLMTDCADGNGAMLAAQSYFFIYHQGNEWWPRFHALVRDNPIPNLCGITSNLDSLVTYMIAFRQIVGPEPTFRILIPATSLFFVATPIALPESIGKLVIECEIHNNTGMPYVHVNIPGAHDGMFLNVRNVCKPAAKPKGKDWKRWMASTSAAWAVGVPSACLATPGGLIVGGILVVATGPLLPAAVLTEGAIMGTLAVTGLAAGTASGTMSAMFIGKKVEEAWDKSSAEEN